MAWVKDAAFNPQWKNAGKVHDWRNYISEEVRAMWGTFDPRQREALIRQAQAQADLEEWD